jgi:hypothetical protein
LNILLTTNKFQQFAGAEIVTLEIAEHFRALGHAVTVASWFVGPPVTPLAVRAGITVTDKPDTLNAFDFDLVWAHHHITPVLQFRLGGAARNRTLFAWRHLSALGHFELPGLVLQDLVCDRVYAVSEEVRRRLAQAGLQPDLIRLFPNPAPQVFHYDVSPSRRNTVRSLLVVSNHVPDDVLQALAILQAQGIKTRHIGQDGEGQIRVTPEMIRGVDVVVSIGKTVQYALCCRTPVYVYDRYGGPGYLSAETVEAAAAWNFSGRCGLRMLAPALLAREIVQGYPEACRFADGLQADRLAPYRLAPYLDTLLCEVAQAPLNSDRDRILQANQPMLLRERSFCTGAGVTYRGHHAFKRRFELATGKRRQAEV